MPFFKGGRFEDVFPTTEDMRRQVSYAWQGDNPPFVNDFHLFEDHDGTFAVSCTLRRDGENNIKSQAYLMSVTTHVKSTSGVKIESEDDGPTMTIITLETNSYETFKAIFKMMKQCLPPSDMQPKEREERGRDRDRMQVDTKNRERDRSPPAPAPARGYLAHQNDQINNIKGIIDNIATELAEVDINQVAQKLDDMNLKQASQSNDTEPEPPPGSTPSRK